MELQSGVKQKEEMSRESRVRKKRKQQVKIKRKLEQKSDENMEGKNRLEKQRDKITQRESGAVSGEDNETRSYWVTIQSAE